MSSHLKQSTKESKDMQFNVRLSKEDKEKLDYCMEAYRTTKGDILRRGINMMFDNADVEKEKLKERADWEILISIAEEKHIQRIREEAYNKFYNEAYLEKYSELIKIKHYKRSDAKKEADIFAQKIANVQAEEAENQFLRS